MTKHAADRNRRRFIKLTVTGLAAAPLANALFSGNAEAADMVSESDPTAVALKYKMDATKAADRKDAKALCSNCNFYTASPLMPHGPFSVFGGNLVAARAGALPGSRKPERPAPCAPQVLNTKEVALTVRTEAMASARSSI